MPIIRSRWIGEFGADVFMVTPAYRTDENVTDLNAIDAADDLIEHWTGIFSAIVSLQPPPWVWTVLEIANINNITGVETKRVERSIGAVGTGAGGQLPSFTAALWSLPVASNPRNAKMFMPGFSEIDTTDQQWDAGQIASFMVAANVWATEFVGTLTGITFTPGMWSNTNKVFHDALGVSIVESFVSHQVRRKVGRGQ